MYYQKQSALMSLPPELIELILKNLDISIIMKLCTACCLMNDVCLTIKPKIKNIVLRKAPINISKLYHTCETFKLECCNFEYCNFEYCTLRFKTISLNMFTSLHVVDIAWGASDYSSLILPLNISKCILRFDAEKTHNSQNFSHEPIVVHADSCHSLKHFEVICSRDCPNRFDIHLPEIKPPTLETFIWSATQEQGCCIAPWGYNWYSNLKIIKIYPLFKYCIRKGGIFMLFPFNLSMLPENHQIEYLDNVLR